MTTPPPESTYDHPAWLAVGSIVLVVRKAFSRVIHEHEATVTRHTATSVVVDTGDRFRSSYGSYVLTPKYLDYRTVLVKPTDPTPTTSTTGRP